MAEDRGVPIDQDDPCDHPPKEEEVKET